jgi:hypothetical protein
MPANMRFCAVQIEVICLLLIQLISTLRSAQFLQTVKKKTNTCLSQETFTTCCMNMSHMFKVIMSCEETFYVHGHFPSSSGGCGGLRNTFPKILYASTEPFAEGPYCFQFSAVPGEIACSCVEPILVQFLWIDRWT